MVVKVMMILVIGVWIIKEPFFENMNIKSKLSGFTLLEIMIVVVIVGLLASVVAPMVSKSADDLLKEEADRFVALVKLAQDESILQSRQLGLKIEPDGYSFLQQQDDSDDWVFFSEGPFRQRKLSSSTKTFLYLDGVDVSLLENNIESEGDDEKKKLKPHLFILSSGEMTPFSYELVFSTGSRVKVTFDAIGNMKKTVFKKE